METTQLEELVYSALKNDSEIVELLSKGESSIFHLQAPAVNPDLPYLVYTTASDVPILHGDNSEKLHRVTLEIHIVTGDGDYSALYLAVKRVMTGLDFTRLQSTPFVGYDGTRMLITDFKKIIGA